MDTDHTRRATHITQALLEPHGGARHRLVDEHMFAPEMYGNGYSRCRLQVYSAPGLRSVAVAIQEIDGDGASLTNLVERYAQTAWRRFCPQEPQPPIWIQHHIEASHPRSLLVRFTITDPLTLASPQWGPGITSEELARLVGGPVDLTRGNQVRRVLEPEPVFTLEPATVFLLPRPDADADRACRPAGISRGLAIRRQFMPVRRGHDCCWYHGGNWHQVSAAALSGLSTARADDLDEDEVNFAILNHAEQAGLSGWAMEAISSLVLSPIEVEDGEFINGRHRTQALLEAGVRRTVVSRVRNPEKVNPAQPS